VKPLTQINPTTVAQLARDHGTPFYLYQGDAIEKTYRTLREALPAELEFFYSLKANPNISIFSLLRSLGAGAEVSSLVELETALQVGTHPKDIIYLGPGKQPRELAVLIAKGIYAIVCESFRELEIIDTLSAEMGRVTDVAVRINPAFSVKGSRLTMGGKPRQFGIDEAQILERASELRRFRHLNILGTHSYMGTRILDEEEVFENTRNIFTLAKTFSERSGIPLQMVDIGGGLGVPYFEGEKTIDPEKLGGLLTTEIQAFRAEHPSTRLIMEMGRYLVADSGVMVSQALYVKESMGEKFVVTDGGTNCHMAAVGIGSFVKRNFPMANLSAREGTEFVEYNVTGPLCTPSDVVGKKVSLPKVAEGDLIGVLQSGAYGPTASPVLFLSFGYPAEILIYRGQAYLIRERDTVEDMMVKQRCFRFDRSGWELPAETPTVVPPVVPPRVAGLGIEEETTEAAVLVN
jgi:diaminopimelate decarboxylase